MELERLLAAARRRWYLVAGFVVFGAALGLLAASGRTDRFVAEATVEVGSDRNVYGSDQVLERIVVNEMDFITSLDLRTAVVDAIGVRGIDPLTDMTVAQRTDTDVVDLRVEGPEENAAIAAVNFWATSWLEAANLRKTESLDAAIAQAELAVDDADAALAASDARVDELLATDRTITLPELFAANPEVAAEQERLTAAVRRDRAALIQLRSDRTKVTPFSIVSTAAAPATAVGSGTGLGPAHGALIGLGLALALIVALDRAKVTGSSAGQITSSFWPDLRRHDADRVRRLSHELRRSFDDGRLQLVGFSSVDGRSDTRPLTLELAAHFADHGYDVTVLTDDADETQIAEQHGVATLSRTRLSDVVDLAGRASAELDASIVFADLNDLWYVRSHVGRSSLLAVVDVQIGADSETVVAESVSRARAMTPTVLTVAA